MRPSVDMSTQAFVKDINNKHHGLESTLAKYEDLYTSPTSSRKDRIGMVGKICSSTFPWSAGIWNLNHKNLKRIRGLQNRTMTTALKLPRLWHEEDQHYAQRCARELASITNANRLWDLDAATLKRLFPCMGHLVRCADGDPNRLINKVLMFRNETVRGANRASTGRVGFPTRVIPWTMEYQFVEYVSSLGLKWQEVAVDRKAWRKHLFPWIRHRLGCTAKNVCMGQREGDGA